MFDELGFYSFKGRRKFASGRVGFAVGDIHGRVDLLKTFVGFFADMSEALAISKPPILVFLGDYIDRGPSSKECIDLLATGFKGTEARFLKGNHEQALMRFVDDPVRGKAWLNFGGNSTLASYGVVPPGPDAPASALRKASNQLLAALPKKHLEFFRGLEASCSFGDYFFAHAGVDSSKPLDQQNPDDLLWIREAFIGDDRVLSKTVVHGHSVSDRPFCNDRRIGLDTGAYLTGNLSFALFVGDRVQFLKISEDGVSEW